ncbi:hypothetical protein [Mastigocoleus testarum]|uniref:Uncharacterized protein n=1 Tax=Mastigocoleus testarum BC008 TaxID=371196 RepID=A0A0V7ZI91_9CYAN|nr:hypothetical protein [Mastigocoleus testarum]KST63868.1 hypothetical protein BC008_15550 [Mastigocoleus testarum BC008]KST64203.1 hypothetical protein BC008_16325 [Mastigocoleus testarum BC008]
MQPSYAGTFEAHITTKADDLASLEKFNSLCEALKVKCVSIELPQGVTCSQPMTASYHHGSLKNVLQEVNAIAQKLANRNFEVNRIKIEAMVNNRDVPVSDIEAQRLPKSNYFEFHVKVILSADKNLEVLRRYCLQHDAHLSRNTFKRLVDGQQERFITMRIYGVGYRSAQKHFDNLLRLLKSKGFQLSQQQREYTVYDSNLSLDAGWMQVS